MLKMGKTCDPYLTACTHVWFESAMLDIDTRYAHALCVVTIRLRTCCPGGKTPAQAQFIQTHVTMRN